MSIFRTLGQEVESNDINKLPGFTELSQGARASVQEAYNAAFTARQHLGMKLAQGAAYATAKAVMEQILSEATCKTCGRPMKEVRNGNVTHKFCPVCNPKGMGYGDSKRRMAEDEANSAERTRGQKEAFLHEKGYRHQGNGVWKHPKTGDTTTITYPKLKEDDSGSIQHQTVIKKDAEEEQPNPTKVGSWGKSPAYPPGSEPGAPLDAETGSAAILKKNHKDKGEPAGESTTEEKVFENSVADALRTAKKQGYNLNGEPKQGALGTTYKMAHPSGHSLQVHSDQNGVNWWHTHRNGLKKTGDDPNTLTAHLNDVDESEIMEKYDLILREK